MPDSSVPALNFDSVQSVLEPPHAPEQVPANPATLRAQQDNGVPALNFDSVKGVVNPSLEVKSSENQGLQYPKLGFPAPQQLPNLSQTPFPSWVNNIGQSIGDTGKEMLMGAAQTGDALRAAVPNMYEAFQPPGLPRLPSVPPKFAQEAAQHFLPPNPQYPPLGRELARGAGAGLVLSPLGPVGYAGGALQGAALAHGQYLNERDASSPYNPGEDAAQSALGALGGAGGVAAGRALGRLIQGGINMFRPTSAPTSLRGALVPYKQEVLPPENYPRLPYAPWENAKQGVITPEHPAALPYNRRLEPDMGNRSYGISNAPPRGVQQGHIVENVYKKPEKASMPAGEKTVATFHRHRKELIGRERVEDAATLNEVLNKLHGQPESQGLEKAVRSVAEAKYQRDRSWARSQVSLRNLLDLVNSKRFKEGKFEAYQKDITKVPEEAERLAQLHKFELEQQFLKENPDYRMKLTTESHPKATLHKPIQEAFPTEKELPQALQAAKRDWQLYQHDEARYEQIKKDATPILKGALKHILVGNPEGRLKVQYPGGPGHLVTVELQHNQSGIKVPEDFRHVETGMTQKEYREANARPVLTGKVEYRAKGLPKLEINDAGAFVIAGLAAASDQRVEARNKHGSRDTGSPLSGGLALGVGIAGMVLAFKSPKLARRAMQFFAQNEGKKLPNLEKLAKGLGGQIVQFLRSRPFGKISLSNVTSDIIRNEHQDIEGRNFSVLRDAYFTKLRRLQAGKQKEAASLLHKQYQKSLEAEIERVKYLPKAHAPYLHALKLDLHALAGGLSEPRGPLSTTMSNITGQIIKSIFYGNQGVATLHVAEAIFTTLSQHPIAVGHVLQGLATNKVYREFGALNSPHGMFQRVLEEQGGFKWTDVFNKEIDAAIKKLPHGEALYDILSAQKPEQLKQGFVALVNAEHNARKYPGGPENFMGDWIDAAKHNRTPTDPEQFARIELKNYIADNRAIMFMPESPVTEQTFFQRQGTAIRLAYPFLRGVLQQTRFATGLIDDGLQAIAERDSEALAQSVKAVILFHVLVAGVAGSQVLPGYVWDVMKAIDPEATERTRDTIDALQKNIGPGYQLQELGLKYLPWARVPNLVLGQQAERDLSALSGKNGNQIGSAVLSLASMTILSRLGPIGLETAGTLFNRLRDGMRGSEQYRKFEENKILQGLSGRPFPKVLADQELDYDVLKGFLNWAFKLQTADEVRVGRQAQQTQEELSKRDIEKLQQNWSNILR